MLLICGLSQHQLLLTMRMKASRNLSNAAQNGNWGKSGAPRLLLERRNTEREWMSPTWKVVMQENHGYLCASMTHTEALYLSLSHSYLFRHKFNRYLIWFILLIFWRVKTTDMSERRSELLWLFDFWFVIWCKRAYMCVEDMFCASCILLRQASSSSLHNCDCFPPPLIACVLVTLVSTTKVAHS